MGYVFAASISFGVGGAFMKVSDGLHRLWPTLAVGLLFLVGTAMLGRAVQREGLTVASVAGLGIEAALAVLLGRYLFGEQLTVVQAAGVVLILGGVLSLRLG